jgi:dTDP-4-amino-4,6-dideoxygalactose transaminase
VKVPLVDLSWQHREIESELREGIVGVVERCEFVLGPAVAEFESKFAEFSGVAHCSGVGSGTDALELALRALGVGAGDEVIVPANTFIASALAVVRAGAVPILVDVDPVHSLIDPDAVNAAIGARTRAIMPVHLYGQMAPMEPLLAVARERGLVVLEDGAQSQGARQGGRPSGSLGDMGATSSYPGKNIGAYGDAGAVLTDDAELATRVRHLRSWGSEKKYHHPEMGFNSRLDTVQAVVLIAKLSRLGRWNALRREAAARYDELLADCEPIVCPSTAPGNEHVRHLYPVRVDERDRVLEAVQAEGVGAGVHYPVPIHLQGAFAHLGFERGAFPETERSADEVLSLPLFPGITEEQQLHVASVLRRSVE